MADKIRFSCPECGKRVASPAEKAGVRMRCPHCRGSVMVPSSAEQRGPQNRFVTAPRSSARADPSESRDALLARAAEQGILLKDAWLLLHCPSCKQWIKVSKKNFDHLVSCGSCAYEFSVNVS